MRLRNFGTHFRSSLADRKLTIWCGSNPAGLRTLSSERNRDCLFFCSDFSGDEFQRDEDQAASSSGRAHSLGVHGNDFSIKAPKPALAFTDELGIKAPVLSRGTSISSFAGLTYQRLFAGPIAMVLALLIAL